MVSVSKPRVLVVDDEENISFLVESALQLDGMETAKAADGHQALTMVRSFNPQAIVLDVMMPGLDGFEVLRRLRSERPRLDIRFGEIDAVEDAIAQVLEGEHDLAFIVGEVPGEIEVVAHLIDPYVFVGPASDHRAAVTVADLNALPMIGQSGNSCLMALDRSLAAAGVQLDYVFRSNDNAAVQAMVRAGMGYSVMPRLTLDLADPGVNVLPLDTVLPPRQVNLVRRRDRTINAAADRFVELTEDVMAQIADEFRVPLPSPSRATLAS